MRDLWAKLARSYRFRQQRRGNGPALCRSRSLSCAVMTAWAGQHRSRDHRHASRFRAGSALMSTGWATIVDLTRAPIQRHDLRVDRRWAQFMEADSWDELAAVPQPRRCRPSRRMSRPWWKWRWTEALVLATRVPLSAELPSGKVPTNLRHAWKLQRVSPRDLVPAHSGAVGAIDTKLAKVAGTAWRVLPSADLLLRKTALTTAGLRAGRVSTSCRPRHSIRRRIEESSDAG